MSNFVDEPPSLKERFDAIEMRLDMQSQLINKADADLKAIKRAVGFILLGLAGQPINLTEDFMQSLGFKTSTIVPASAIVKPA